ncbi:hypothetical protein [Rhodoferax antarcticus]|uniref:Uncharacterized protein n=1 Tax=Rhodoferax antarcticus ANT.BR TaxID=1111071 RepID=A0A1Q8YC71_9BURK|nr:hypothetical protein [Rhodoferax antarcticus]MCW2313174.1 putative chitinase [Rhodoferax antarcticus]OLP05509.1 hypothetical protein BLL52_3176 [Rhodoferax antarcticus ANT.BR]
MCSACEYWRTRGLNDIANHADTDMLKKKYRGNISIINDHLLTVVIAKGKRQARQTSSL